MVKEDYRNSRIYGMIPKDVKTVLDIGSAGEIFAKKYKTTTIDLIEDADIKQDLDKDQKIPFKDNSFDIVVLNQIIEHLTDVEVLVAECKRVSKKYIFVGLPNELTYGMRLKFLFGKPAWGGYYPEGHKHFFIIRTVQEFVEKFFDKKAIIKKGYYGVCCGGVFPYALRDFLAKVFPTLFAREIFYLIKK